MGSLYSISGFFYKRAPEKFVTFGGAFAREIEDLESPIVGCLVDMYGVSDIEGKINDFLLEFKKKYYDGRVMDYEFIFNKKKGLWEGKYSVKEEKLAAICKIHEDFRNLRPGTDEYESVAEIA